MQGSGGADEGLLISQATAGDAHAQAALLESHRRALRQMVSLRIDKRVAARVDPSDIIQDAMHDAHQRLPAYLANPRIPLYLWLRRITCDRLADVYRTHIGAAKRSVLKEHPWAPNLNDESVAQLAECLAASSINPHRRAMESETHAHTIAALRLLKPLDREILVLRYLEQMSVEEVAQTLAVSPSAVTSRHLRALQRIRLLLGSKLEV